MNERIVMLLGALALDLLFGEPPTVLHPVVWMGRYIGWGEPHTASARPLGMFLYGAALITLGIVVVVGAAVGITAALNLLPRVLGLLVGAWLLKTTFAARALTVAAHGVQRALERGDLPEARRLLSWHLVSRDTNALDEGLVAAAAVESVAENFSDSLVAPLLFFALFGLPGAFAYRFANTADAMLGYRDARREYFGRFAARLDDVLNFVPSRITALLLLAGAALAGAHVRGGWPDLPRGLGGGASCREQVLKTCAGWPAASCREHRRARGWRPRAGWPAASCREHRRARGWRPRAGWRVMWRDHARTPSPNAGWPMSAMAGVLGVTLEKVGHYRLGDGAAPDAHAIARSLRVAAAAGVVWVALVSGWLLWLP